MLSADPAPIGAVLIMQEMMPRFRAVAMVLHFLYGLEDSDVKAMEQSLGLYLLGVETTHCHAENGTSPLLIWAWHVHLNHLRTQPKYWAGQAGSGSLYFFQHPKVEQLN